MFKGAKASSDGGGSSNSAPDTLFSDDVVELILGLSEGPIVGLDNGARSFLVADTPLVDTSGTPNLGKFDLRIHTGQHPGEQIIPKLGGSGASTSVGVQLETDVPVVRSGSHTQIDYLEIRIAVQRLLAVGEDGETPNSVTFSVEKKALSASTWGSVYDVLPPAVFEQLSGAYRYTSGGLPVGAQVNPAYRETYIQSSAPGAPLNANALWFSSGLVYKPFSRVGAAWVDLGATQHVVASPGYSYWEWVENAITRRAYYGSTGTATPPLGLTLHDFWVAPTGTVASGGTLTSDVSFIWNGSAWVNYMDWAAPPVSPGGNVVISGKTTSTYVKELRIPVPRINEPYSIRVTKLSPINTTKTFADIAFESFQEISATPLQFDDLAVAHLTIKASDQFSSVPEFSGVYRGRTIQVPTNYNPVSRVYTGIWDGTFKIAYTNNPAWIVHDLVNNDRYGMAAYYIATLDKFAVYAFAQHCDAHGFTYNEWITEPRNLTEAIDYICGIAGGRFVDPGDGFATILFDADDQPAVHLFTPENVIDGVFSYAFTDITSRKNDFTVSFVNEAYNWVEDRRRVYDTNAIAKYGRNPEEFVAVGCIDELEAIKRARLRLAVSQGEKAVCSWRTNRQGLYVQPYSIVLIADPDSGFGLTGRIASVTNATTLQLRDPIYFEAGLSYQVLLSHVGASGLEILTFNLVTTAGSTSTLTLATALTQTLAAQCAFSISTAGSTGAPKAYRITNIEEVDGEPDNVSMTGIEVNRNKWAFVDGAYTPPGVIQTGQVGNNTYPVSNIRVEGQTTSDGLHNILMQWDASPSPLTRFTRIYYQINGGSLQVLTETRDTRFTLLGAQPATYTFSIVAVSLDGQESPPVSFQHEVLGDVRAVTPPQNFKLLDGVDPTTFRSRNPAFSWTESADPFFQFYRLRIYNQSTGVVLRVVDTVITSYVYDYTSNVADFGTASRTFRVELRAVDKAGSESQPLVLLVSNPQIAPPSTVVLTSKFFGLFIDMVRPTERDYTGTVIYASTVNGFTPGPANLLYDGPDTSFRTTILEAEVKYVRVGFYDDFSNTTTLSAQFTTTGAGLDPGTVSYDKLTTALQSTIDAGGSLGTTISALSTTVNDLATQTYGAWTVKIQTQAIVGGTTKKVVSGFGLAQSGGSGEITSDFVIAADRFLITPSYNASAAIAVKPVFAVGTVNGVAEVGIDGNMVLDGSITARSVQVTNLAAIVADLGVVTAGVARSVDGKFYIDFNGGFLTVSE